MHEFEVAPAHGWRREALGGGETLGARGQRPEGVVHQGRGEAPGPPPQVAAELAGDVPTREDALHNLAAAG